MPSLTIIKAGLMSSIQDSGRKGWMYYAIPRSGAMNTRAATQALKLLGKDWSDPVLECTGIAPHLCFHQSTTIALSGADFGWTLNGEKIPINRCIEVPTNSMLKGKGAKNGWRGYLAIQGKLKLPMAYGSFATYAPAQIGGYEGRYLRAGDTLEWEEEKNVAPIHCLTTPTIESSRIPIRKGPEFSYLEASAQQLLTTTNYKISTDSNRMGIRLSGVPLQASTYQLKHSLPILAGFIQLPPSGLPIIILQDGQISGGYPRIAYVPPRFLGTLSQIPLGGSLQFELIS
ncbi:MAG: hypothetical protein AAF847_16315 [Bacteroidota bacterium]